MGFSVIVSRWSRAVRILRSRCLNSSATIEGEGEGVGVKFSSNEWIWPSGGEESKVVGRGRGWVAVFNKRSNDLFLSDPVSHRITNLPPIHTLPGPDVNMSVSKVVLSSSPGDDECRAMMMFGPTNRLAFCSPAHSSDWTPIGDLFFEADSSDYYEMLAVVHEDLVYCTRSKVFTTITAATLDLRHFWFRHVFNKFAAERFDWDIQDPTCPKMFRSRMPCCKILRNGAANKTVNWATENHELLTNECIQIMRLVYAEKSDQLFLAIRFVRLMKLDGSGSLLPLGFVPRREDDGGLDGEFLGKTHAFIVMEFTKEKENLSAEPKDEYDEYPMEVVEDLNGMAIVAGNNHSFVIHVDDDHHHHHHQLFKPNSIYFTDAKKTQRVRGVVNDAGVFSYATKTICTRSALWQSICTMIS